MASSGEALDVVVLGCGAAGVAAALAAAETVLEGDTPLSVTLLERTDSEHRGGSTRYTGAFLRVNKDLTPADHFEEDIAQFSSGQADTTVVRRLAADTQSTLQWVGAHGVAFDALPTSFLTSSRPRTLPVGGGKAIVDSLATAAQESGAAIRYRMTGLSLEVDDSGALSGISARNNATGLLETVKCRAVVLASGGFEGDARLLAQYLGTHAVNVRNISPGGYENHGEGIRMALQVGAETAGRWDRFHAEPIDPRSNAAEAALMIFPYGLLINKAGVRFVDEGVGTVDESYEDITRAILDQPGGQVYCVGDRKVIDLPGYDRAVMSPEPPIQADTLEGLVEQLDISDRAAFLSTIQSYNDATSDGPFEATRLDHLATRGLVPKKSNWARAIDTPPYVAWPFACSIVFTFGGLAADSEARVLSCDGIAIPGLYAAGEITGLYYGKYPGATSVLRGLVYGRIAGRNAVKYVREIYS